MHQLKAGLSLSIEGPRRARALRAFRAQIRRWGCIPPKVEPLVLDFGLGEFFRTGLIEYWIANEAKAGYCGKYLFVFGGQSCPRHRHRIKHETFFLVQGRLKVEHGNRRVVLRPGETLALKPGVFHSFTGLEPSLLLELSMPCEVSDNFFADRRIPIGANYQGATTPPARQSARRLVGARK